jgi:hypothetical protein
MTVKRYHDYIHEHIEGCPQSPAEHFYASGSYLPLPDPGLVHWTTNRTPAYRTCATHGPLWVEDPWRSPPEDSRQVLWPLSTIGHMVLCLPEAQWKEAKEWARETYRVVISRRVSEEHHSRRPLQKAWATAARELDLYCFHKQLEVLRDRPDAGAHVHARLLFLGVA